MIEVIVNRLGFEYDIHSLVKAFFPKEDASVRVQETFAEETGVRMELIFTDTLLTARLSEEQTLVDERTQQIDYEDRKETKNHLKRHIYLIYMPLKDSGRFCLQCSICLHRESKRFPNLFCSL